MRDDVAEPMAGPAVLFELERRTEAGESLLIASHERDALRTLDRRRQVFAVFFVEPRLGIESIDVTGPSAEPDKDTAIRLPSRLGSPKPVGTAAGSYHSHCAATTK